MIAFALQFRAGSLVQGFWETRRIGFWAVFMSGLAVVVMAAGEAFALLSLSFDQNVGLFLVKAAMAVAVTILFVATLNAVYAGLRAARIAAELVAVDEESSSEEVEEASPGAAENH
jgi:hypothetical protein